MLVVYANESDESLAYNWKNYKAASHASIEDFQRGIKTVFDRSQQRMDEMRKVACSNSRDRDVVINM